MKERAESISSMDGLVFAKKNFSTLLERPVRVVKQVRRMPNLRDLVGTPTHLLEQPQGLSRRPFPTSQSTRRCLDITQLSGRLCYTHSRSTHTGDRDIGSYRD